MTTMPLFERPFERAGVITPGLPILPPGVERHPVPGGGSRALPIYQGDEIHILDREGLQPVELVFFSHDGRSDAAMIGAQGGRDPAGLKQALLRDPSGRNVLRALDRSGFDLGRADGSIVFAEGSRAEDTAKFTATVDGL